MVTTSAVPTAVTEGSGPAWQRVLQGRDVWPRPPLRHF